MRWYYKLIEKSPMYYRYAYSREAKDYDGEIIFFVTTETGKIEKPCAIDKGSDILQQDAFDHFWYVVKDGFPEERSVCCG